MKSTIFPYFALLILIVITTGCISGPDDDPEFIEYYYNVEGRSISSGFAYFPIPVHEPEFGGVNESQISKIIKDIDWCGSGCRYKIEYTFYGYALNITWGSAPDVGSTETVSKEDRQKHSDYFFNDLTLKDNSSSNRYYIYTSTNLTIQNFECYAYIVDSLEGEGRYSEEDSLFSIKIENVEIEKGWNSVILKTGKSFEE